MTCDNFQRQLDDYLDGELPESDRQRLEEDLVTCLSCNRVLKQLRTLIESARHLPTEIEPERPLWPGIESRIAAAGPDTVNRRRPATPISVWRWASLAAAAALLFAIAVPLLLERQQPLAVAEAPAAAIDVATTDPGETAILARSEDGVLLPRSDLLTALEQRRSALNAEDFVRLEANVRLVDEAIAEVRTALDQNPGDRRLELLLAARYQQEVALLKQVNRV